MTSPNLGALRRRVERRMTVDVNASYFTEEFDPETNQSVETEHVVWSGIAHIRPASKSSQHISNDILTTTQVYYEVWLPVDAVLTDGTEPATALVPTASVGDPTMIGRKFAIVDPRMDDWRLAIRMLCQASAN